MGLASSFIFSCACTFASLFIDMLSFYLNPWKWPSFHEPLIFCLCLFSKTPCLGMSLPAMNSQVLIGLIYTLMSYTDSRRVNLDVIILVTWLASSTKVEHICIHWQSNFTHRCITPVHCLFKYFFFLLWVAGSFWEALCIPRILSQYLC